jgi:PKHD-type hydroxylase
MKLWKLKKELDIQLLLGLFDMYNYYVRKILDDNTIKRIKFLLEESNTRNLWFDGCLSASGDDIKSAKVNMELPDSPILQEINDLIMMLLDKDRKFVDFTAAKSSRKVFVSKTSSGGFYHPHTDNWDNGDYSTTVFLNDPNDYVGGELCLYLGGEEETKIKLDAGWAVTYPTGVIHRVNKVLTGTRYVSVFWTESLIKDSFIRNLFCEISSCIHLLQQDHSIHLTDCKGADRDPFFKLNNLKTQILRRYSDK